MLTSLALTTERETSSRPQTGGEGDARGGGRWGAGEGDGEPPWIGTMRVELSVYASAVVTEHHAGGRNSCGGRVILEVDLGNPSPRVAQGHGVLEAHTP